MNNNGKNCVYKLTSPSGKVYIGQTVDFQKRMKSHKECAGEHCPKLYRAIRKYGWENFNKKILLENLTLSEMDFLEEFCISVYDSIKYGYNVTIGGYGVRGENGRALNYGSGKYGFTKDDESEWRKARYYDENNHEKILKQQRVNYAKHAEKRRESKRKYWEKNKELLNAKRREKYNADSSLFREKNHNQYLKKKDRWKKYNQEYYAIQKEGVLNRNHDITDGSKMMFSTVSNKYSFRRIFVNMFGGGRTVYRHRPIKYHGVGKLNEWGDWLYDEFK